MNQSRLGKVIPSLFIVCLILFSLNGLADPPPPPPPGGGHGATGNQGPMQAPIPGGILVYLTFAAGAAGFELYRSCCVKKRKEK